MSKEEMLEALGEERFVWKDRCLAYSEAALQYGLVVLICLLPSALLRPVKGALLIGLFVAWIVHMLVAKDFALRRTSLDAPLAAYIVWIAFTLITAAHVLYSLGEVLKLVVSVLVFYLVVNQARDRQAVRRLLSAIVLTTFAVSSYGILKFFLIQQGNIADRAVRANSLTPNYHWLSTYLILAIPILLCLAIVQQNRRSRLFLHMTCALSCVALFLTYTRGAWVALLAELCVYGWTVGRKRLHLVLAGGAIVVGLAGLLLFASKSSTMSFSPSADTLNPYTLMTRIKTSELAIQEILKHPLMGIGYGGKAMVKVYPDAPELQEAYHPHNLYVEVALGTGIPGLILLLWIFIAALRATWGGRTKAPDQFGKAVLLALGMVVVGIIVSNLFDHIFAGGMAHLFWVLAALAAGVNTDHEQQTAEIGEPERILVVKLRYLGDVLLSTPVIASLRAAYPNAVVSMLVNPGTEAMIATNPHLDEVLIAERDGSPLRQLKFVAALRRRRFDLVLDLTDGDRAAILSRLTGAAIRVGFNREGRWRGRLYTHLVPASEQPMSMIRQHLMALEVLGIPVIPSLPVLKTRASDEAAACAALSAVDISPGERFVAVHPGARWWFKSWPAARFAGVIDYIQGKLGIKVVLLGSAADQETAEAILGQVETDRRSLVGRLTLFELAGLLRQAALLVGNDNGPMHIAAAMGTPVVGLFGPADPRIWGPAGQGHATLYKGVDCGPCFPGGCLRGEQNCMRLIELDEVISVVKRMLETSPERTEIP